MEMSMKSIRKERLDIHIDTINIHMCKNVCLWHDGTLRPAKGHNGNCRWVYDGQVFYHTHDAWVLARDRSWSFDD